MPNYNIEMVDVATLNNNLAGGNYIVLGRLISEPILHRSTTALFHHQLPSESSKGW